MPCKMLFYNGIHRLETALLETRSVMIQSCLMAIPKLNVPSQFLCHLATSIPFTITKSKLSVVYLSSTDSLNPLPSLLCIRARFGLWMLMVVVSWLLPRIDHELAHLQSGSGMTSVMMLGYIWNRAHIFSLLYLSSDRSLPLWSMRMRRV
jgi:hypothetical protein